MAFYALLVFSSGKLAWMISSALLSALFCLKSLLFGCRPFPTHHLIFLFPLPPPFSIFLVFLFCFPDDVLNFIFLNLLLHFPCLYLGRHTCAKSLQSCPTLCDPMDHSPPGSCVHGILQARMLEWGAMPSSRASSWLRDWIRISYVSCTGRAGSLPLVPARHIHLCKCTYCVCVFYVEKVAWQGGGAWEEERKRRDKQEHPQSCMDSVHVRGLGACCCVIGSAVLSIASAITVFTAFLFTLSMAQRRLFQWKVVVLVPASIEERLCGALNIQRVKFCVIFLFFNIMSPLSVMPGLLFPAFSVWPSAE